MRSRGFKIRVEAHALGRFAAWADAEMPGEPLSSGMALAWLGTFDGASDRYGARLWETLRTFSRWACVADEGSSAQPKGSGGCHGRARPYIYGDATTGPAGTASCPGRSPCPGPAGSGTASPPLTPTTRLWTSTRSSPTPSERRGARDAAPLAVILARIPTPNSQPNNLPPASSHTTGRSARRQILTAYHEKSTCLCNQIDAFSYIDSVSLIILIVLRESLHFKGMLSCFGKSGNKTMNPFEPSPQRVIVRGEFKGIHRFECRHIEAIYSLVPDGTSQRNR